MSMDKASVGINCCFCLENPLNVVCVSTLGVVKRVSEKKPVCFLSSSCSGPALGKSI